MKGSNFSSACPARRTSISWMRCSTVRSNSSRRATSKARRSWLTSTAGSPARPAFVYRRSVLGRPTSLPAWRTPTWTVPRWSPSPARARPRACTRRVIRFLIWSTCSSRSPSMPRKSASRKSSPRSSAKHSRSRRPRSPAPASLIFRRTSPPRRLPARSPSKCRPPTSPRRRNSKSSRPRASSPKQNVRSS